MEVDPIIIQNIQSAITQLNHDYTAMTVDVAVLKSQMAEVVWLTRGVVGAAIGLVVARGWKIFTNFKNNKP